MRGDTKIQWVAFAAVPTQDTLLPLLVSFPLSINESVTWEGKPLKYTHNVNGGCWLPEIALKNKTKQIKNKQPKNNKQKNTPKPNQTKNTGKGMRSEHSVISEHLAT